MNSRRKGAKNERNVAKLLETWTGKKFAKTPASGGLQWQSANSKGDVVCTTEGHYFPFCIEAKSYNKIDFSHLLTPGIKNVDILTFWAQCKRDATKCNKVPILMMRYNGLPKGFYFLVIEQKWAKIYHENFFSGKNLVTLRYHDYKTNEPLMIYRSPEFFTMSYKEIRKFTKNLLKNANR